MRSPESRFTAQVVTGALCQLVVAELALADFRSSVPAHLLAKVLLLSSAMHRSPSWVAEHSAGCPSDETIRKALLSNLPGQPMLEARLVGALHSLLPARLKRCPLPAALDLHLRPYYGDKDTPGTSGGEEEAGTDRFWVYARLALVVEGVRYTVGLVPVDRRQPLGPVVRALLDQAKQAGVRLRYLLLDRGFYDAEIIQLLQQERIPFLMPMIKRGQADRGSGTTPFFQSSCATGWYGYGWTARPRRRDEETGEKHKTAAIRAQVRVCVWNRGPQKRPWVYVAWQIDWPPQLVVKRYRARFGIETSYRQIGEVLAVTTSKDERVRLLLLGLALLLRQYWCLAHDHILGQDDAMTVRQRQELWRLSDLLLWLIVTISHDIGVNLEVAVPPPPPRKRAA